MTSTAATAAGSPRRLDLASRLIGILTSPRDTFRSVVAHPAWFGVLAVVAVGCALLVGGFLSTQAGQDAWLETATRGVSGAAYDGMARMASWVGYLAAAQMLIMIPVVTVITAGILYAIFNALGGDATFRQVMAVVSHAGVVSLVGQLFTVPINYLRGAMASATNLAVFFPDVPSQSFTGWMLSMTDLFIIWYVLVLAIGLGVLYRRRTQPVAVGLYVVYGIIILLVAAVASRLGGA